MNPVETYLKDLGAIHSTGAADPETSGYGPLEQLLNEVGKGLKPKVRCIISLSNRGAGKPDGGLFTAGQFQKKGDAEPKKGQPPERGVLEVKAPGADVRALAETEQVQRYHAQYGLVLLTNYRQFLLVGRDAQGNPLPMEAYTLAETESAFWDAAGHPQKTADRHAARFAEYLKRVMLSVAPLSDPKDLAWFLASYARDAKARVESADVPALAAVRQALESALGMKFTGEHGEHFFRSTLVQTIFYGVFSAWVLWNRERPGRTDPFDWRMADWTLHVPFIRTLYHQISSPGQLGPLGLVEVLDWTAAALNRVDRPAFFQKFQDEHAVQYFYEPFLEAFDPELRKELGVWYTPPEIVQYQVARVDTVLREELGVADGLADPNVVVLDPCCGTAAYLVEVLRRIADTLKAKPGDALIASDLKKAAMTRVFGFEILPAPFVVSHLQLGLMLHRLGVPLSADERVGVYLTNSLTGWAPPKEPKTKVMFSELEAERDAADSVKRDARILVILGNPPYNAFAGTSPEEEECLVEAYKGIYYTEEARPSKPGAKDKPAKRIRHCLLSDPPARSGWGIKKFNLDDLYVRFFRLAERRIAEMTGRGVVSFISNFSYLGDPSFVVMRQRFLSEFDVLWFDCMNGDSRETGKLTPEGKPDPSVFSTEQNREGIRVGTTVSVIVRKEKREKKPTVRFRNFWGVTKRQDLLHSLAARKFDAAYTRAKPTTANRHSFRPERVSAEYVSWPSVAQLSAVLPFNGPIERRGNSLIVFRGQEVDLVSKLQRYLDPTVPDDQIRQLAPEFMTTSGEFDARKAREALAGKVQANPACVVRYPFKPFDVRVAYLDENIAPLFSRPSPDLLTNNEIPHNAFFITRDSADKTPEGPPFHFSPIVCDYDFISGHARHFPLRVFSAPPLKDKQNGKRQKFLTHEAAAAYTIDNLSPAAQEYLAAIRITRAQRFNGLSALLWLHALAIGYSPAYLTDNADGIRRDWPRIPLPGSGKSLQASAALGQKIAALLNAQAGVPTVTTGRIAPIFRWVGCLTKVGGGSLDPHAGDLAVTAGWGHAGRDGATMPAKGRIVQRPYDEAELQAIDAAAKTRGLSRKQALALLGHDTRDVYLNGKAYWKNIPANVWQYYIGGYQVIKKWLSYREQGILGRPLRAEEAREVTDTARRLTAIILLQPALDDSYRRTKANAYPWPHDPPAPSGECPPVSPSPSSTRAERRSRSTSPSEPRSPPPSHPGPDPAIREPGSRPRPRPGSPCPADSSTSS